jgi:hypothetical protein
MRRRERELEMQERERELQKQRQAELQRKAAERSEIQRLSKTFAITLEGSLVLSIPPEVILLFLCCKYHRDHLFAADDGANNRITHPP